ncbi:5-carboxymethyl-2-hydroxymuconate isomerase [Bradyrhizobium sp. LM3.6]
MPHFTIEYSANLDSRLDIGAVCEIVRKAAVETGIFPLGGIRVRAVRCEHYAIADARQDYGFLDMVLRIGEGRDLKTRKTAGEHVFPSALPTSRSRLCSQQIRFVVRHADQRQGHQLETQQHPRRPESGGLPWISSRRKPMCSRPTATASRRC